LSYLQKPKDDITPDHMISQKMNDSINMDSTTAGYLTTSQEGGVC